MIRINKCNDYCTTNVMITIQQMQWLPYNKCVSITVQHTEWFLCNTGNDYYITNVMITIKQI